MCDSLAWPSASCPFCQFAPAIVPEVVLELALAYPMSGGYVRPNTSWRFRHGFAGFAWLGAIKSFMDLALDRAQKPEAKRTDVYGLPQKSLLCVGNDWVRTGGRSLHEPRGVGRGRRIELLRIGWSLAEIRWE